MVNLILLPDVGDCTAQAVQPFLTYPGETGNRPGPPRAIFALERSVSVTIIITLYWLWILHSIVILAYAKLLEICGLFLQSMQEVANEMQAEVFRE